MGQRKGSGYVVYVADAFARQIFGGNQAGVVILGEEQEFPGEALMRKIAGEMKHSETAFVKRLSRDAFRVRYFTPVEEVALCGHATIGTFGVLYEEGMIGDGSYLLYPGEAREGQEPLGVLVEQGSVWMDMAPPRIDQALDRQQAAELYEAYGLDAEEEGRVGLLPAIVNTGLSDIILPVTGRSSLERAVQDCRRVTELSRQYQVVGVHMFCLGEGGPVTAYCRNFAPAVGIDEESATGTSNGALTWYLYRNGLLEPKGEHLFLQGEAMGKPSYIKSRLVMTQEEAVVQIGGQARIFLKGQIFGEDPGEAEMLSERKQEGKV